MAGLRARGIAPARVLEPTCGSGAFLAAAAHAFPAAEVLGIEFQRERFAPGLAAVCAGRSNMAVRYADVYALDAASLMWNSRGPLLVVGNPPWVTAAALGRLAEPVVQPPRTNPKRLRGLAARTGAANFDVAEFLILKLLRDLGAEPIDLALLVKESVARKVLAAANDLGLGIAAAEIVRIDARGAFGVAVDACCLIVKTRPSAELTAPVPIRSDFDAPPIAAVSFAAQPPHDAPPVVFRQGIKHDAADVFELTRGADGWRNGYGQVVDVEHEFVFPLMKARALHAGESGAAPMAMIVPQARLGAATDRLEREAPRLWRYLCAHGARLDARKSSIYRHAPRFALFGVGPYSFAPWKVGVAGLYAQARFRLLCPRDGRPVVVGDTAYFAAFADEADARAFANVCAQPDLAAELAARIVRGKRPITKALLDGIDWRAFGARDAAGAQSFRAPVRERRLL